MHGLAALQQCSRSGLHAQLLFLPRSQCGGWLSSTVAVPCQATAFSLESDGAMASERSSVSAASSKLWLQGDVACSSGSCVSVYPAWTGSCRTAVLSSSVLWLQRGDVLLANTVLNSWGFQGSWKDFSALTCPLMWTRQFQVLLYTCLFRDKINCIPNHRA